MTKALGTVLLKVGAFWILLVAAYLALGRQFFPHIERYNAELALMLGDLLETPVTIGGVTGEWRQFNPILIAKDVHIGDNLRVEHMLVEPALFQSLVTLYPVFKRLELSGFEANLVQTDFGWSLGGLGGAAASAISLERLIGIVRQQREVRFTGMALQVEPLLLPEMTVAMDSALLTGLGDENWMRAAASVNYRGLQVPVELQLESSRANDQYEVDLYARHGAFDISPWLRERLPELREAAVAGEYWVSLTRDKWQSAQARLQSPATLLNGRENDFALRDVDIELFADRTDEGIDFWVYHLGHELTRSGSGVAITQGEFAARGSLTQSEWQLQWDRLPMAPISALLSLNDGSGYWRTAFPTADITQGEATYQTGQPDSLRLTAEVNDLVIQPHAGIPGLSGVSGGLRGEGSRAQLRFDNTNVAFRLPAIYRQPFSFERISGALDIRWAAGTGIQLEGRHKASIAPNAQQRAQGVSPQALTGHWRVDLVSGSDRDADFRELGFRLAVDGRTTDASWVKRLTPDRRLPEPVKPWISANLESGTFSNVNFSFMSGFRDGQMVQSGLALSGEFENAVVRFADRWPQVRDGSGTFILSLDDLQVEADSAELSGITLRRGQLTLPFKRKALFMNLEVEADAERALALFKRDGPLDFLAAEVVSDWTLSGIASANMDLRVPLDGAPLDISLTSRLENGNLDINPVDLSISEITGQLGYNAREGLYANQLKGRVFGEVLSASLSSQLPGSQPSVQLTVSGDTPLDAWGRWLGDPWLSDQPYQVETKAQLNFTTGQTHVRLQSDLVNLPLALPVPLGKGAAQERPFEMSLLFKESGGADIAGRFDDALQWSFSLLPGQQVQTGTVALNTPLLQRDQPGIFIDAVLPDADLDEWRQTLQTLRAYYQSNSVDASGINIPDGTQQVREVNLSGSLWRAQGLQWTQPRVQVLSSDDGWLATLNAHELRGRILIPFNGDPHFADFDFVNLNRASPEGDPRQSGTDSGSDTDPMASLRPEDIPDANIQIARLSSGGRDLGSWRGELRREANSVVLRNLSVEMPEATLDGQLTWQYLDGQHRTLFDGRVLIGNILEILNSWDYAPVLESRSGRFDLNFEWPGTPAFFDFERLRGRIELRLADGSILELEEYEGVKLVGLLNFTRILRRLALDFSDLIREGISYDVIEGELLFDRGFVRVGDRLLIDGPATKFRFSGDADLVRDLLDVDMIMTVPLSSTFPLVALLAGVSPQAAAAIYVTERVFNNELERLSSARMHIAGSLEEPELKFYRVFGAATGRSGGSGASDPIPDVMPDNPSGSGTARER